MYHTSTHARTTSVTEPVRRLQPFTVVLTALVLMLALCHLPAAMAAPANDPAMLSLAWDAPDEQVHHYVLEVTRTAGDEMAEPTIIRAYTDGTTYDLTVMDGCTYEVSILAVDEYGNQSSRSEESVFMVDQGSIVEKTALTESDAPGVFSLHQNFPNPFNPATTIQYDLPTESHVTLAIFTVTGQKIAVLQDGRMTPGSHSVRWDAADMPSGTYFCTITTNEHRTSRKMLLLK